LRDEGLELRDSSKSSRVQKVQEIELSPNGQVVALNIPAGQWHTVRALESGSVILEMNEGAYEPLQDCDILSVQP
jgi:cupin fold WbuC family metalloprotein